jgi:hypothetical protein
MSPLQITPKHASDSDDKGSFRCISGKWTISDGTSFSVTATEIGTDAASLGAVLEAADDRRLHSAF